MFKGLILASLLFSVFLIGCTVKVGNPSVSVTPVVTSDGEVPPFPEENSDYSGDVPSLPEDTSSGEDYGDSSNDDLPPLPQ